MRRLRGSDGAGFRGAPGEIITCMNCTQDANCAAVVCLGDLRKRRGFFEGYPQDEPLDLVGLISCAGCPTVTAPEKILRRVKALADFSEPVKIPPAPLY